jgi:hypothetical protein
MVTSESLEDFLAKHRFTYERGTVREGDVVRPESDAELFDRIQRGEQRTPRAEPEPPVRR